MSDISKTLKMVKNKDGHHDRITFRGNKKTWDKFMKKIKGEGRTVWSIIGPFIRETTRKK